MTCSVCWEKTKSPLFCPDCRAIFCLPCLTQYIAGSEKPPTCFNKSCSKVYDLIFLYYLIPRELSQFRGYFETMVTNQVNSLLPETARLIERDGFPKDIVPNPKMIKYQRKIQKHRKAADLERDYRRWLIDCSHSREFFDQFVTNFKFKTLADKIEESRRRLEHFTARINKYTIKKGKEDFEVFLDIRGVYSKIVGEVQRVIEGYNMVFPCGRENCRGLLDNNWVCLTCSRKRCSNCHLHIDDDEDEAETGHICKKKDIKSAKLVMEKTRSCPTCGMPIERTVGCKDMFCTQCKSSFNWDTGEKMANKDSSNPMALEYVGSSEDDHDLPSVGTIVRALDAMKLSEKYINKLLNLHILVDAHSNLQPPIIHDNNSLHRIHHLAELISFDTLIERTYNNFLLSVKSQLYSQAMEKFRDQGRNIIYQALTSDNTPDLIELIRGIKPLVVELNQALYRISYRINKLSYYVVSRKDMIFGYISKNMNFFHAISKRTIERGDYIDQPIYHHLAYFLIRRNNFDDYY